MVPELKLEYWRNQVREELRKGSVKLWLPPFYVDGKTAGNEIKELAKSYSHILNMPYEECMQTVHFLQESSLSRLREREQFRCSGLATLRVRLCGVHSQVYGTRTSTSADISSSGTSQFNVEVMLSATGKDLENTVKEKAGIHDNQLKLICNGLVIRPDTPLLSQRVNESSTIMALVLNNNIQDVEECLSGEKLLQDTRKGVMSLQKDRAFEIEDQKGNIIHIPKQEKKSLITAMALYDRGRAALKREEFACALLLFLEAEKEFGHCNQELLKMVDNAALLNLDIVWCYLCLRSVTHIPDAEKRLDECERKFAVSYGQNMERLIAIKGTAGNEAALIMRLHLLQAIVLFHNNKLTAARTRLNEVEQELNRLRVNENDVIALVDLGYTHSEALLGLRASQGDRAAAVALVTLWREERSEARKRNLSEKALNIERKKLGKIADGSAYIEPTNVNRLVVMGFERDMVISALHYSNNNLTQAVQLIQEQPHLLHKQTHVSVDTDSIAKVAALGFDTDIARIALQKHHGDIEKAVEDLIQNNGFVEITSDRGSECHTSQEVVNETMKQDEEEALKTEEELMLEKTVADEVAADLQSTSDINDHLIISLQAEERFLNEYKALLE